MLERCRHKQHQHDILPLNLANLASVRSFAERINDRVRHGSLPPIRALVLNAGWQEQTTHTLTGDGFDASFQVNYLSQFLLTLLLLRSMDKTRGRIVVLGSWTHDTAHPGNKLGGYADMYTDEYERIFRSSVSGVDDAIDGAIDDIARGRWSSAEKHPGDANAGMRRYGAAKLCQVMML